MKTIVSFILVIIFLSSCSRENPNGEQIAAVSEISPAVTAGMENNNAAAAEKKTTISDIQIGMRDEKVKALLGKPSKVDTINSQLGARMEDWWYGTNQKVRMTGGQVTHIVKDVAKEQETLEKIRQAKERGDEAEAKRLLDEMAADN